MSKQTEVNGIFYTVNFTKGATKKTFEGSELVSEVSAEYTIVSQYDDGTMKNVISTDKAGAEDFYENLGLELYFINHFLSI
jgi:hypothetical protein